METTLRAVLVAFFVAIPTALPAQTAQCRKDLAEAHRLVQEVQAREPEFSTTDESKNCRLLRLNSAQMIEATKIMARCMTGFERNENVGQMEASLGDINDMLASKCR